MNKHRDNLDEMRQQGQALRDLAAFYSRQDGQQLLQQAATWLHEAGPRLCLTGMGSSHFASRVLAQALAADDWLATRLAADDLLEQLPPATGARLLLTSQSGKSGELVELAARYPTVVRSGIAITNDTASPLAQAAGLVLPLCAGREDFSATKTFSNTLALFHLLAAAQCGEAALSGALAGLGALADGVDKHLKQLENAVLPPKCDFVIGCDFTSQAVAEQAALLSKEVAHVTCEPLSFAAFLHGTQEVAGTRPQALVIAHSLTVAQRAHLHRLASIGLKPFVVSGAAQPDFPGIELRSEGLPWILAATLAVETWTYQLALAQGLRPGHYQVGEKVTVSF